MSDLSTQPTILEPIAAPSGDNEPFASIVPKFVIKNPTVEEVIPVEPMQSEETVEVPKKRTRKKKEVVETESIEKIDVDTTENVAKDEPLIFRDHNMIERALLAPLNDPEWESEKEELVHMHQAIVFPDDMNASMLKCVVSQLVEMRNTIQQAHSYYQSQYLGLVGDKPEGLVERVKRLNAIGSNEDERRKNAIRACQKYELYIPEEDRTATIDLFELVDIMREKHLFYKGLMDSIDFKSRLINNMSTAIKAEVATLPYEN